MVLKVIALAGAPCEATPIKNALFLNNKFDHRHHMNCAIRPTKIVTWYFFLTASCWLHPQKLRSLPDVYIPALECHPKIVSWSIHAPLLRCHKPYGLTLHELFDRSIIVLLRSILLIVIICNHFHSYLTWSNLRHNLYQTLDLLAWKTSLLLHSRQLFVHVELNVYICPSICSFP